MLRKYPNHKQVAKWPRLQAGDTIDVIAPASACRRSELMAALGYLKARGFKPRVPSQIFMKSPKLFAQTDEQRLLQLQRALLAPDSKAVWCVRGGYGALRLMPELLRMKRPRNVKILVGYSDISTLHAFVQSAWKWPSLHGPLLDRFGRGQNRPQETREVFGLLTGDLECVHFRGLRPLNAAARKKRVIKSRIVGGNLTVVASSLGTPSQVLPSDHLVFFEDLGERPHRLDRMLTQLAQAGYFKGARGVLFGPMLIQDKKDNRLIWQDVLPRFAKSLNIPVLFGLPCGHGKMQRPLPLLSSAELKTGPAAELLVHAPR